MKISVEIKDDIFDYEYEVGPHERGHGTMPLGTTGLDLFISILRECQKTHSRDITKEMKEIECMAYIEKHPELLKKYKNKK